MPADNLQKLCSESRDKLKSAISIMETFLNEHALSQLVTDEEEETVHFYKGFLSDVRHLLVFSEVSYEKLGVVQRRPRFDIDFAEKALYHLYHRCVNNFFYPKNESYSEDGRYAYTGQDAIRFRMTPVRPARDVIMNITRIYEELREDLAYYESDYLMGRRLQPEKSLV